MNYIGVNTPERAAEVWSEGVKGRSAAIQYSVMTKELKEIYAKDLDKWRPNWVTGVSSPWVESYEISSIENPNDNTRVFEVEFSTTSPGSGYGSFTAVLEVINDGGFWRISNVAGDGNSEIYTGFINQS